MTPHEERLLELDLREVLGAETPPDVWPAIAAELAPRGLRLRYVRGRARPRGTAARPQTLTWVAAALLVACVGLLWWSYRPRPDDTRTTHQPPPPVPAPAPPGPDAPEAPGAPARQPFGRLDRTFLVGGVDGEVRADTQLAAGERVAVDARGATLRLRDGATLDVGADTWLALHDEGGQTVVEVGRGDLAVATGDSVLTVREAGREVSLAPSTRLSVERRDAAEAPHPSQWLESLVAPAPADLVITVDEGRVDAQAVEASAGQVLVWLRALDPRKGAALPDATRLELDGYLAALDRLAAMRPGTRAAMDAHKAATQSGRNLRALLAREPRAWGYAVPWLDRRVRDTDADDAARLALPVLVLDPELRAIQGIHRRLQRMGLDAGPNVLLPLAERSEDPVAVGLMRRQVTERTDPFDVYPAAYLALRGDDAGREVLEVVLRNARVLRQSPVWAMAAAAGLHRLGQTGAWQALRAELENLVDDAIRAGQPVRARFAVQAALYFAPVVRGGEIVSVANVNDRIQQSTSMPPLATAADLRRAFESLP